MAHNDFIKQYHCFQQLIIVLIFFEYKIFYTQKICHILIQFIERIKRIRMFLLVFALQGPYQFCKNKTKNRDF